MRSSITIKLSLAALLVISLTACSGGKGGGSTDRGGGGDSNSTVCGNIGECAADWMSMYPAFDDGGAAVDFSSINIKANVSTEQAYAYNTTLGDSGEWIWTHNANFEQWNMTAFDDYYDIDSYIFPSYVNLRVFVDNRSAAYADLDVVFPSPDANVNYAQFLITYLSDDSLLGKFQAYQDKLIDDGVFTALDCKLSDNTTIFRCSSENSTDTWDWNANVRSAFINWSRVQKN